MRRVLELERHRLGPNLTRNARVANAVGHALVGGAGLDVWMNERLVDEMLPESRKDRHPLDEDDIFQEAECLEAWASGWTSSPG